MKIVLLVVGPAIYCCWAFLVRDKGTGLLAGPHNAILIDAGAGRRSRRFSALSGFAWR